MTATVIKKTPSHALGHEMTEAIKRVIQVAKGPTIVSDTTLFTSTGAVTVELFSNVRGIQVVDLQMITSTLWSGTGNEFIAGDADNTSRFYDTTGVWISTDVGRTHALTASVPFTYRSSDPDVISATVLTSTATAAGTTAILLYYTEAMVGSPSS